MLTRRWFGACLICTGVGGFVAAEAAAQGAPAGQVKRKLLKRTETGIGNLVTLLMEVEIPVGAEVPRHTHPGVESAFVLDGEAELYVQGQIPPEVPHGVRKVEKPLRLAITYVVDKNKPLLTPAPA